MTEPEISTNAEAFRTKIASLAQSNLKGSVASANKLDEAYARLTTIQAWKEFVADELIPVGPRGFFVEAQNDAILSNVLVSLGLWRSALKSLRSLTENVVQCVYYKDHPVEYELWENEKHRMTFKSLFDYLEAHPNFQGLPDKLLVVRDIKNQYSRLSKAVHSSIKPFRMTSETGEISLGSVTKATIGKWSKEQKVAIQNVNLLLLVIFRDSLQGSTRTGLRRSLRLAIPLALHKSIRDALAVTIPKKG
jgi:hypothetical protein